MSEAPDHHIRRLTAADAPAVMDCFRRVYADSYGNDLFYDEDRLTAAMRAGRLRSVGAVTGDAVVIGHMAMTTAADAQVPELGNTVVDPVARGAGIAWQVGAELTAWTTELGYTGYVHYPTTDHHIMQRQSVKSGFETGLMLGYIPAETDGKVGSDAGHLRQAATIVYAPLGPAPREAAYKPAYCEDLLDAFVEATGLERQWLSGGSARPASSSTQLTTLSRRGLARLRVTTAGADLPEALKELRNAAQPCRQIDFSMADPHLEHGIQLALDAGYVFCGWLPGFAGADVFRLQWADPDLTNWQPEVVNPVAQSILARLGS